MKNYLDLSGKVAVVTGAGSGRRPRRKTGSLLKVAFLTPLLLVLRALRFFVIVKELFAGYLKQNRPAG